MTRTEFMELTPIEFFLAIKDNQDREESKVEILAESIRMSTWYLLNVQLKRRIRSPKRLWALPNDIRVTKEPQTAEEMKNVMRAIASDTKHKKSRVRPVVRTTRPIQKR